MLKMIIQRRHSNVFALMLLLLLFVFFSQLCES